MALPPLYRIHPSIGIARLGDATKFFIGPEIPGARPSGEQPGTKVPPFKDRGKIKPQAARFRIFEYVDKNGEYKVSREVSLDEKDVTNLKWTVHLANRKASFFSFDGLAGSDRQPTKRRRNAGVVDRSKLEIDPGPRSVTGKSATPVDFSPGTSSDPSSELWPAPPPSPAIKTLGRLMTDGSGRLLVLGGLGVSTRIPGSPDVYDYANNDGWFDDISDGPVSANLQLKGNAVPVTPAWVLCAPPDFAPHLRNIVSLYDMMYDVAARELTLPTNEALYNTGPLRSLAKINAEFKVSSSKYTLSSYKPDFATEIFPILYCAAMMVFLFSPLVGKHSVFKTWNKLGSNDPKYAADRHFVFTYLRHPNEKATNSFPYMPKILGDEPYLIGPGKTILHPRHRLTLTFTQYAILQQWERGNFIPSSPFSTTGSGANKITPDGLDRAALENCVGGAFYPGIEVGWQARNPKIFMEPFRVKHGALSPYLGEYLELIRAGYFSRQMAVPWQADFLQCKSESDHTNVFGPSYGAWAWWPGARPDMVFLPDTDFRTAVPRSVRWHRSTKKGKTDIWPVGLGTPDEAPSYMEMLDNWYKFGFVVEKGKNLFVETEREADIP